MAYSYIFNFLMPISSMAVDPQCDFYQDLTLGQEYYIYNLEYSSNYTPYTACRWVAKSPRNTSIVLTCNEILIPASTECQGDRLSVSLTGNLKFEDGHNYCGRGNFTSVSVANTLSIGLFATSNSVGGRFLCTMTAIRKRPIIPTTERPDTCDCGARLGNRIVGGHETGINEYPLMSALVELASTDLLCGSSLISDRYAITAAHCLLHKEPTDLALLVGDHNITSGSDTEYAALYSITTFIQHHNYNIETNQNDIAVIKTSMRMKFSTYVGPVCLPFRYTTFDFFAQQVTVLGWGFLQYSGPMSEVLEAVDLNVVSNQQCSQMMTTENITLNQLCTFSPQKDACQSDSGGPVLWQDPSSRRMHLVGIVSYGLGCASDSPGVNTRVTAFLTWITSVTSDAVYCIR